eukprot:1384586-Rhodomonas_salina.3
MELPAFAARAPGNERDRRNERAVDPTDVQVHASKMGHGGPQSWCPLPGNLLHKRLRPILLLEVESVALLIYRSTLNAL